MVDILVILDGASEPLRAGAPPTSLERAVTPALDRLAREGELSRVRTVAAWLEPGSEAAIPALLGWTPPGAVDRGALEAAAYGIDVPAGSRAWRVDVVAPSRDGAAGRAVAWQAARAGGDVVGPATAVSRAARGGGDVVAEVAAVLRDAAPPHAVHRLAGHRLLLVGPSPLPRAARGAGLRVWVEGAAPARILGPGTVVVGARGAAIGAARLMGACTVVPAGATGLPSSDLAAKAAAAIEAIERGATRVVVHVGGPDEAAHQRDPAAKVEAIERADREVVGPLATAVGRAGGTLTVCPDHGCDPATGEHDAAPVPRVRWSREDAALRRELLRILDRGPVARRLTERAVAHLPAVDLPARRDGVAA